MQLALVIRKHGHNTIPGAETAESVTSGGGRWGGGGSKLVTSVVFFAQSTSAVISGRGGEGVIFF